jgi:phospholipid/cholesterol/gamma-HCH transport system substrate-binding protein
MTNRFNYALVGLFVLILGAAWLVISLWLTLGDYSTQYTTYRVYIDESVSGLYRDAPVKYRGVEVGKVAEIDLNPDVPDQVQLTLDVIATTPIRTDTVAELSVQGLTGIAFLELKGGTLEAPVLTAVEGQEYPVIPSAPSFFARLDMSGTELIGNINALANRLAQLLDADGRQSLREILANINTITAAFARRDEEMEQIVVSTSRLMENGAEASKQLEPLLVQIGSTAESVEVMAGRVADVGDSLDRYIDKSGSGVQQFSQQTLPEFGALIRELRQLANTLQHVGKKLEDDPRALIYGDELQQPGPGE